MKICKDHGLSPLIDNNLVISIEGDKYNSIDVWIHQSPSWIATVKFMPAISTYISEIPAHFLLDVTVFNDHASYPSIYKLKSVFSSIANKYRTQTTSSVSSAFKLRDRIEKRKLIEASL